MSTPAITRRRLLGAATTLALTVPLPLAGCASARSSGFGAAALARELARRPVVLLGEVHDNPLQHRVRAEALAQHLAAGARPALAFEQFDRSQQAAIDAARAGLDRATPPQTAAQAIVAAAGARGWDWPLYQPFIALALQYELPIVPANLARADAMKVGRAGDFAVLFDAETQRRLGLDRIDAAVLAAHRQAIDDGHCNAMPPHLLPALARAQIARDITLLESIRPHMARGVVLLTGNGHVRRDIGVPYFMTRDEQASTHAIGLLEVAEDGSAPSPAQRARFDAVFVTPRHTRPDPCESLRKPAAQGR